MVVFHVFDKVRLADVLLRPGLAPDEGEDAVFLRDVVCHPSFKSVRATDLFPNNVWRLSSQWVFNVDSLLAHTLFSSFVIGK